MKYLLGAYPRIGTVAREAHFKLDFSKKGGEYWVYLTTVFGKSGRNGFSAVGYLFSNRLLVIGVLLCFCTACSDGSSSGGTSVADLPTEGEIQFEGLEEADIEVFNALKLDDRLCQTEAEESVIQLNGDCIERDEIYWIKASNTDSDQMLCTIMDGESLYDLEQWYITPLTDTLCQSVENYLTTGPDKADLLASMDTVAALLLSREVVSDKPITSRDIYQWQTGDPSAVDKLLENTDYIIERSEPLSNAPFDEVLIGRLNTLHPANKVVIDGNTAYVATDVALLIVDLSDKRQPTLLGSHPTGWIKDLVLVGDSLYLSLGTQGVERVDVSDPAKPALIAWIDHPADAMVSKDGTVFFHAKVDQDIIFGAIEGNEVKNTWSERLPTHTPLLLKIVDGKLLAVSTTFTESFVHVIEPDTLELIAKFNLQKDYSVPPTSLVNDIFFWNDEVHVVISPPYQGLVIGSISPNDYALLGTSYFPLFSLVMKNDVTVYRLNGVMRIYENMNYQSYLYEVVMPEDVKLIYFDDDFDSLNDNPSSMVGKLIDNSGYLKRFQLSKDNKYSYFASDRYGFSVISHLGN